MPHDKEWYDNWVYPILEHGVPTKWQWIVLYPKNLELGFGTDIGAFTLIHAGVSVEIGEYVEIGGGCKIYSVDTIGEREGPHSHRGLREDRRKQRHPS